MVLLLAKQLEVPVRVNGIDPYAGSTLTGREFDIVIPMIHNVHYGS